MLKQLLITFFLFAFGDKMFAQTILGIDVSHYQGTINWSQVAAAGKVFAWAKSTEGVSYTDPQFVNNETNGNSAGVVMGAYHFARPETNAALDEANYFLSVAGSYIGTNHLPPVLDLEDPSGGPALSTAMSSAALSAWVQTWMSTVQNQTGVAPVIYTSSSYAAYLSSSLNVYKLWIAKPDGSATAPPTGLGVWNTWAFKQYSWSGTVSGITGSAVDLDVFNGTSTDFNNLVGSSPCTAPVNDNCPGTAITSNGPCLTGTVACATGSYGANHCAGCSCTSPDDYDVYYSFTAQATSHTITLSNYASNFDAVIELRTACALGSGNYIGCFDSTGIPASVSHTWNNLTIGQTYYIRIFSYNYSGSPPSSPTFDICVTHSTCTPPTASISPANVSICNGGSATLTASGGGTYLWSTGANTSSILVNPSTTTTYTVTVTSNGCSASAGRTVTVNSVPVATITPNSATICNGSSTTLTAGGGGTYLWSNNAGSASILVSPAVTTTYSVTVTTNGCSATAGSTVNVDTVPVIAVYPPSVTICTGGNGVQLQVNGAAATYVWSPSAGLNASTGSQVTANPTVNTTYTVTATNGSCSATASSLVTVSAQAVAVISPQNPVFCPGDNINLYAAPNGSSFSWSGPNGFTAGSSSVNVSLAGTYNVTITDPAGCSGSASAAVSVMQYNSLTVDAGTDQNIQSGDSVTIGGNPVASGAPGPYNYTWGPAIGLSNTNTANPFAAPDSTVTYYVSVTDADGCSGIDSVVVYVTPTCPTPVPDFTASQQTGTAPLSVTYSDNSTNSPAQWWWTFPGGSPGNSTLQSPTVTYSNVGLFNVSLVVVNSCGTDSITKTNYINIVATGIKDLPVLGDVSVFPNPNHGTFTVTLQSGVLQAVEISCINMLGEKVYEKSFSLNNGMLKAEINMSSNAAGGYLLRINAAGKSVYRKITIADTGR